MKKHCLKLVILQGIILQTAFAQNNHDTITTSKQNSTQKNESVKGGVKVFYVKDDKPYEMPKSYPLDQHEIDKLNAVEKEKIQKEKSQPK